MDERIKVIGRKLRDKEKFKSVIKVLADFIFQSRGLAIDKKYVD